MAPNRTWEHLCVLLSQREEIITLCFRQAAWQNPSSLSTCIPGGPDNPPWARCVAIRTHRYGSTSSHEAKQEHEHIFGQRGRIQAGIVKMFGLSCLTVTWIYQPSSGFRLDVLGWRNYDFLVEQELLLKLLLKIKPRLYYECPCKEAKEDSTE